MLCLWRVGVIKPGQVIRLTETSASSPETNGFKTINSQRTRRGRPDFTRQKIHRGGSGDGKLTLPMDHVAHSWGSSRTSLLGTNWSGYWDSQYCGVLKCFFFFFFFLKTYIMGAEEIWLMSDSWVAYQNLLGKWVTPQ